MSRNRNIRSKEAGQGRGRKVSQQKSFSLTLQEYSGARVAAECVFLDEGLNPKNLSLSGDIIFGVKLFPLS